MTINSKYLTIVPTYMEEENIDPLLSQIFAILPDIHILFVDDNSQDKTRLKIRNWMQKYPDQVHILERSRKEGLGKAYLAGFAWALARDYLFITEMDADLSHRPKDLLNILSEAEKHPVIVGSRYISGGGTQNWGLARKLISKAGSLYARTILRMPTRDMTGGFNCWRREVLEAIDLNSVESEGYSFQIELKFRAFLAGFAIHEQAILFEERRAGQSKMSSNIVLEAMLRVWSLAAQRRLIGNKTSKSCLPG